MEVITQRPIFYNAEGDKKLTREERQKERQERNKEREGRKASPEQIRKKEEKTEKSNLEREKKQQEREKRRAERRANRTAKRLIKVKKDGLTKFFYPLTRVRNGKKKNSDNSVTEVKAENIVTIPNVGDFDKMEVLKATKIDFVNITPQTVLKESTLITPAANPTSATESDTKPEETIVAVEVPKEKVVLADDGNPYASGDLDREEKATDDTLIEDDKKSWWSKQEKTTKGLIIAGSLAVVGTIVYLVIKHNKK